MDELDCQLKELVAVAKQHPSESVQRKKAITRLLMAIRRSGKLSYTGQTQYPDLYHDALQETWAYIARNIDKYDPTRAKVMTWINYKLEREFKGRVQQFARDQKARQEISLSRAVGRDDKGEKKTLEDQLSSDDALYLSDHLRQILAEDPDGLFRGKHLRGKPELHFQMMALHLMDEQNMRNLAARLNVKEQTLYSFFRRACKELRPHIERYLQEI